MERHLPADWWKSLFNAIYLKTDGDVVENTANTQADVDLLIKISNIQPHHDLLDLCCGQGRHSIELARRGYQSIQGIDRSRDLIRLARKRAKQEKLPQLKFSEGDARSIRLPENSKDAVFLMGNSFGYFESEQDDLKVLESIKKILKSEGRLILDIVNGQWMAKNFEPRSWEWIDQNHFVNRERSLDSQGKRIITREVVTHADMGVIADQFYAERLYTFEEIQNMLTPLGFSDIILHANIQSISNRNQDLGMMAHRMLISARGPNKSKPTNPQVLTRQVTVILGDPHLPDSVKKNGKFNEEDLQTIQSLKNNLKQITNYQFNYWDQHSELIEKLKRQKPDFVFNLCDEGFNNHATQELHIPALLELFKVPYSGAGPACLAWCYDKSKVRAIAQDMDIPVPLETYFDPSDQSAHIPSTFPALLKPSQGDSSIGITQKALVQNAKELMEYLNYLRGILPNTPILIQEFLSGTEYSVGLIGNPGQLEALPVLEVDYSKLPQDLPRILSYESKWLPDSPYWDQILYMEAKIEEEFKNRLINYSKILFERLDCRDYARFDFRCDSHGQAKLLEVNPNPGWCWDGKLNLMAGFAGKSYKDLLEMILNAALERSFR